MVTEGNYSDYTQIWESNALSDVDAMERGSTFTDDDGKLVAKGLYDYAILNVSNGNIEFESTPSGWSTTTNSTNYSGHSIYGKYWFVISSDYETLRIYKDGTLLKTLTKDDTNDEFEGAVFSPSGKYFAFVYYDNSDGDRRVRCFQGV